MKRTILLTLMLGFVFIARSQNEYQQGLVDIAKIYKNNMFGPDASKGLIKDLKSFSDNEELSEVSALVIECITSDNKVLKPAFLSLPDDNVLKSLYIIRELDNNMRKEGGPDHLSLVDSLMQQSINRELLINSYYAMIFTAAGNKNKPFNLSKYDFDFKELNLVTDEEQGIFFLRCMDACGTQIWGFMNIVNPPNTESAMEIIDNYPKINGEDYFQFTDLYFDDFEFSMNDSLQSYKSFFLDKYFELLLNHATCLHLEDRGQEAVSAVLMNSILREEELYEYTKYKETLEGIFKKVEGK